ncbi:MAG: hypothetical protein HWE26_03835 [Alteromonadaceae bacterium]|nr:hypothetical protein [Alteromonadaceae bacterium]
MLKKILLLAGFILVVVYVYSQLIFGEQDKVKSDVELTVVQSLPEGESPAGLSQDESDAITPVVTDETFSEIENER